jgi:hypothetical protein
MRLMSNAAKCLVLVTLAAMAGCQTNQPCDRYVDYVCNCHEGDPDYDCTELQTIYADAQPDVQDQCALDLDDLKQQDETDGYVCANATTAR